MKINGATILAVGGTLAAGIQALGYVREPGIVMLAANLATMALSYWQWARSLPIDWPIKSHAQGGYDSALDGLLVDLQKEIRRARAKFPRNRHLNVALQEEVGELARAQLQREPRERIRAEAVQVACVALRIAEEGDEDMANLSDEEAKS